MWRFVGPLLAAASLGGCVVYTEVELFNNSGVVISVHDDLNHSDNLTLAIGEASRPIMWPASELRYQFRLSAGGCDYHYAPGAERPNYDYPFGLSLLGAYRFKAQVEPDFSLYLLPRGSRAVAPLEAGSRLLLRPFRTVCR